MLISSDGHSLHTRNWLIDAPKASLILVHGLGEHSARYAHVAAALNKIGVNVYSFDIKGHGLSGGPRAFVKDIAEYRADLTTIYNNTPKNLPIILLGHSMGGLIVADFLLQENVPSNQLSENQHFDIKAVILSGPALMAGDDITPFKKWLVRALNAISPHLSTIKLDTRKISRDPTVVNDYINDPLIFHGASKAATGAALLNAMDELATKFSQFTYPLLIMHGAQDSITNPAGSQLFYTNCTSEDKTLKLWYGAFHEVFNETNQAEVINYMTTWLSLRI